MTNINCALECEHQKDGKCTLDDADAVKTINESCAYFSPLNQKEKTAE